VYPSPLYDYSSSSSGDDEEEESPYLGGGDGVAAPRAFVADDDVTAVGFIRHFLLSHPCPTPSLILPAAMT
jgi:hypothetical protein